MRHTRGHVIERHAYPTSATYTGWPRLIGLLKLDQVRKRTMNHRVLLRKITYTDKASCGSLSLFITVICAIRYGIRVSLDEMPYDDAHHISHIRIPLC